MLNLLIKHYGEKKAFGYVNKILKFHSHTASLVDNASQQTSTALTEYAIAEQHLLSRLTHLRDTHDLPIDIRDSSATPFSGDIICTNSQGVKSVWDSKDYQTKVPWNQVQKLARDVRIQGACFGVIVAPNGVSRIPRKQTCDGVDIYAIKTNTHEEFGCLFLSAFVNLQMQQYTIGRCKEYYIRALTRQIHVLLQDLRGALSE